MKYEKCIKGRIRPKQLLQIYDPKEKSYPLFLLRQVYMHGVAALLPIGKWVRILRRLSFPLPIFSMAAEENIQAVRSVLTVHNTLTKRSP